MFTSRFIKAFSLTIAAIAASTVPSTAQVKSIQDKIKADALVGLLRGPYTALDRPMTVKTAVADGEQIRIKLSDNAKLLVITPHLLEVAKDSVRKWAEMPTASVKFYTSEVDLSDVAITDATAGTAAKGSPVRRADDGFGGTLTGRNIALWASHGRYYEAKFGRWEWQRGRLMTTVEDILTPSFVLPFLIPMLDNAGAMVFTPRERDTTRVCTVVDDADKGFAATRRATSSPAGFAHYETLTGSDNPFAKGTAKIFEKMDADRDSIVFSGTTEASGPMMVYLAYPTVTADAPIEGAEVIVRHADGEARYSVNQSKGGGMWMPLDCLPFKAGKEWSIVIKGDGTISADAVRIGGGMGATERDGSTSGMPAWAEAARYYLQADGFDYKKVLSLSNGANEYTDDINARGEWVNSLIADKGINIDLSFALHTDAGVTRTDSTFGTLALITTKKDKQTTFADGRSRQISHQLAGCIMTSVLGDIRRVWDNDWTTRGIADKKYAESRRPDVPAVLLELLSHQNVSDMRMGLHPAFRRDVARAIYKGIARFLNGPDVAITPLAPSCVGLRFAGSDSIQISWVATVDSLEPSATTDRFAVYEGGRLLGMTSSTSLTVHQPQDGIIRTYHVVAIGPGGRSMPSEHLSACLWEGGKRALLVEGMDRLAAPKMIENREMAGVFASDDEGAPWAGDVYSTGDQFDFAPENDWVDDDAPGCGASYADREMKARNGAATYSTRHSEVAQLMRLAGYSFVSQSKTAFDADTTEGQYDFVRINLDRQKTTSYGDAGNRHGLYTVGFCRHIESLKLAGTRIVLSGRFVGTDAAAEDGTRRWCANILGFAPRTGHASRTLGLRMMSKKPSAKWLRDNCLTIPNKEEWHPQVDAIEPASGSKTVCRYTDTEMSAGVENGNLIVVGF